MKSDAEIKAWAAAYIEAQSEGKPVECDNPLWWAVEWPMALNTDEAEPECVWKGILEVLSRKPSDDVLGMLAASPLEDLIHYHGEAFIDRIEVQAKDDPAFRKLLCGVWESSTPEVWSRIVSLQEHCDGGT